MDNYKRIIRKCGLKMKMMRLPSDHPCEKWMIKIDIRRKSDNSPMWTRDCYGEKIDYGMSHYLCYSLWEYYKSLFPEAWKECVPWITGYYVRTGRK
jgi:hypothetical protein